MQRNQQILEANCAAREGNPDQSRYVFTICVSIGNGRSKVSRHAKITHESSLPTMLFRRAALCIVLAVLLHGLNSAQAQSESFDSAAQKATAAREAGRAEDAIHYSKEALHSRPNWDEGLWYLGTIYYDLDHYADAIPVFRKLTELQPKAGPVWNLLGLSEFETKDYSHALPDLQRGLELGLDDNPGAAKVAKYHVALLLNLNGEFEQAAKFVSSDFTQGPVPDQIKTVLGLALLRVPLLPEQVDPSKDALVQSVGEAASFLIQSNFDQALPVFERMLKDYPDAPLLHFAYGSALNSASRDNDAVTQLREQTRLTPQFASAHEILGQILRKQGKTAEANKEFETAKQFAANREEVNATQARAYGRSMFKAVGESASQPERGKFEEYARQAVSQQKSGDYIAALASYKNAVALRADWDEGWTMIGTLYYMTNRCPEAVPAFKTATGLNPKRSEAWALLGICEFQAKDYKNSLIHLQQSQKLGLAADPTGTKIAKYHMAYLLNMNGDFDQAMDLLVPEVGPSSVADQIKLAMGLALLRIPLLPEQLNASQQALVRKAGEAAALLAESKYDRVFPIFQQMLKDAPNTPFLHYAYGVALASNSQYAEAQTQLKEETRLNPSSALPYMRLASINLLLHLPQDALPAAQRAAELAPDAAEGHYLLGRTLLELKRAEEAVAQLEIASRFAPNSPGVHFSLAKAYTKAGKREAADRERETFTRLNALVEKQRSTQGSQIYAGSHDQGGLDSSTTPE
jgi:tetratricopeptide (TPR) repeat protein